MREFWRGKRVFLTGHTGFKGSWLSLWLLKMGAEVTGYALEPETNPSLFDLTGLSKMMNSVIGDVSDYEKLRRAMKEANPEIVIHMAAQPLVRRSYAQPVWTYMSNVMGTVHLLEAVRLQGGVRAVVNVTTDKCYENKEWTWGYREIDRLGGYDPYSNSKACSELATSAYRQSYDLPLSSARAGNVIGGGDWSEDRLFPDIFRALSANEVVRIRHPRSIRPWQHVLEPLSGYLSLAQKVAERGAPFTKAFNFGPNLTDVCDVETIVRKVVELWEQSAHYETVISEGPHEAQFLKLDCSLAKSLLGWEPRWSLDQSLPRIVEWYREVHMDPTKALALTMNEIEAYEKVEI